MVHKKPWLLLNIGATLPDPTAGGSQVVADVEAEAPRVEGQLRVKIISKQHCVSELTKFPFQN